MREVSEQDLANIYKVIEGVFERHNGGLIASQAAAGRAALEACRPLLVDELLAEPTEQEIDAAIKEANGGHCWSMRILFANRRRLYTEQPDRAVEAVKKLMCDEFKWGFEDEHVTKIVALVDEKRGRK